MNESAPVDDNNQHTKLAPGIHAVYDLPANVAPFADGTMDSGPSLEQLMAQIKSKCDGILSLFHMDFFYKGVFVYTFVFIESYFVISCEEIPAGMLRRPI